MEDLFKRWKLVAVECAAATTCDAPQVLTPDGNSPPQHTPQQSTPPSNMIQANTEHWVIAFAKRRKQVDISQLWLEPHPSSQPSVKYTKQNSTDLPCCGSIIEIDLSHNHSAHTVTACLPCSSCTVRQLLEQQQLKPESKLQLVVVGV